MRALGKFTRVTLGHSGEDEFYAQVAKTASAGHDKLDSPVGCRECGGTSLLRKLGSDDFAEFGAKLDLTAKQLTEVVLDRANSYYRVLWSGLTASERLCYTNLRSTDGESKMLCHSAARTQTTDLQGSHVSRH